MSLESFYGGKQGVSPVIKAKFKYITAEKDEETKKYYDEAYDAKIKITNDILTEEEAVYLNSFFDNANYEKGNTISSWLNLATATLRGHSREYPLITPFVMDECLKLVDYTDVWYGELCIIDTDNKMNPNNGKLYRRTLKQTKNKNRNVGDTLYAEYIGQIVGPSGGIPNFDFGSLDAERKKAAGILPTYEKEIASEDKPLSTNNWDYAYPKDENGTVTNINPQNDYEKIAILSAAQPGGNEANIQMKPGKEVVNNKIMYNDTIRYTWCNVQRRLDGKDDDAWIYLGFEIPYTVYDVNAKEENYTYKDDLFEDKSDSDHPFYKNYIFHIPRGARGIGPEQLFIVGKDNQPKPAVLYDFDAITYDQTADTYSVNTSKIKNPEELTYWVAKWRLYNPKTTDVTDVYQYIGAYKDIKDVQLLADGKIQIQYSNKNNWYDLGTITWITSATASLDDTDDDQGDYGQFKLNINFNNNITNTTPNITIDKNLHLIKNVTYNDDNGQIKFDYSDVNNGILSKTAGNIEYIKSLEINTNKDTDNYGKVTGTKNIKNRPKIDLGTLPLIKSANYDENSGIITFNHANGLEIPSAVINPDDPEKNYGDLISYISKMKVTDNGTIQYQLNTESGNTWHNITDGNTTPKSLRIKDIDDLVIATPTNLNSIQVSSDSSAINGHLYIKYRGDTNYEDLGLVKGNAVVGPVYTLKNGNNPYFDAKDTALRELQNSIYDESSDTDNSVGGNGSGKIKANGEDVTGGLVAAQIKNEGENTEPYTALFYYDTISGTWVSAGLIGEASSDSGSNVFIEQNLMTSSEGIIYPQENDINPEFYFKDGASPWGSISVVNRDNSTYNYENWINSTRPLLGPMPWQTKKPNLISL